MSADSKVGATFKRSHNSMVTKTERDALIAARPKPIVEQHLTIGGTIETTVRQSLNAQNEARISRIRERLGQASNRLNQDRSQALVRGTAKADFDRSR